jgi:hypothetical protein
VAGHSGQYILLILALSNGIFTAEYEGKIADYYCFGKRWKGSFDA